MIQRSSPIPLYCQIAQMMEKEILENRHQPDAPFYSDRQLLEKYGVSLLTARQAISELVRKKLVRRHQGRGTFITGKAMRLTREWSSKRGDILFTGWSLSQFSSFESMYFHDVFNGIQDEANKQGLRILFDNRNEPCKGNIEEEIGSGRYIGAIALIGDRSEENAIKLHSMGLNTVTVGFAVDNLPAVLPDSYKGGGLAVEHLLSAGCRKIAHLNSGESSYHWTSVKKAYVDHLGKAGLSEKDNPVFESTMHKGSTEAGYQLARSCWKKHGPVDGVFAGNDFMAIGALQFFSEIHVDVPRQVKVIGFDNIEISKFSSPPLSTIAVDRMGLGRQAVHLMQKPRPLNEKAELRKIVDVRLEVRGSTSETAGAASHMEHLQSQPATKAIKRKGG